MKWYERLTKQAESVRLPRRYGVEIEMRRLQNKLPLPPWVLVGTDPTAGVEMVTRPMRSLDRLERFLRQLEKAEPGFDRHTGLHVHVDASDLDHEALKQLLLLWKDRYDELVPPQRRARVPLWVARISRWSWRLPSWFHRLTGYRLYDLPSYRGGPWSEVIDWEAVQRAKSREELRQALAGVRGQLSLLPALDEDGHGTVEFRGFYGTADPEQVKRWVTQAVALVEEAKRRARKSTRRERRRVKEGKR